MKPSGDFLKVEFAKHLCLIKELFIELLSDIFHPIELQ